MLWLLFSSYLFVRLDGSMTIKKRAKIVEKFNNPCVSINPGPEVVQLFPCSTQLIMKFQLDIESKML